MQTVTTAGAPPAGGHYSQAIIAGGFVFVAGQLPFRPDGSGVPEGADAQTRQALANVAAILEAAGRTLKDVASAIVFVSDIAFWPDVDRAYAEVFGEHRPARTVANSPQLHHGCLVEIQVTAVQS